MADICGVEKDLYVPSPRRNVCTTVTMRYVGKGLRLEEIRANVSTSDLSDSGRHRFSEDNGRTWSDWEILYREYPRQGNCVKSESPMDSVYDPVADKVIRPVFQRIFLGDPKQALGKLGVGEKHFFDHAFYQISGDNASTWGEPQPLKYEAGASFDPNDWGKPEFLYANEMYVQSVAVLSEGGIVIAGTVPVPFPDGEDEKTPVSFPSGFPRGCVGGVLCFIGHWNSEAEDYEWITSESLVIPRRHSTRGLFEPAIGELTNGDLLLVMRASNAGLDPEQYPGPVSYTHLTLPTN